MAALIVETGLGVTGANSYVSVAYAQAYLVSRNDEITFDDSDLTQGYLLKAMDYLQAISDYLGYQTYIDLDLQWPRQEVVIDGRTIDDDIIPSQLKNAQIQLALAVASGIDIMPNFAADNLLVKVDKVGPLQTEYFAPSQLGVAVLGQVDLLLRPLLRGFGTLVTRRA